jgi:hypothetical protein
VKVRETPSSTSAWGDGGGGRFPVACPHFPQEKVKAEAEGKGEQPRGLSSSMCGAAYAD